MILKIGISVVSSSVTSAILVELLHTDFTLVL